MTKKNSNAFFTHYDNIKCNFSGFSFQIVHRCTFFFKDDFNSERVDEKLWIEHYGGSISEMCGYVVSGSAFTFYKVRQ